MKFRSSILSLAAVSALTATAFMVTGCGSSSSSSGTTNNNQDTSTNLTGSYAKGFWGGIPYTLQRHSDNSTTAEMTTESGGAFKYSNLDNATFNMGLGLKGTFDSLNLVDGADIFAEDATTIKQGTTTVTADKEELMTKIGAIYQQMGVLENATDVDAARVNAISKQLDAVYTDAPTKYAVATGNQLDGLNAVIGDLYTALISKLEAAGITLTDKQKNVTDLKIGYTSNVSDVTTQRDKIIAERATSATLTNAPAAGDLKNAILYIARPASTNDTYMSSLSFGGTVPGSSSSAKGQWINGTILQEVTTATGAVTKKAIFTTPDYTEGSEVRYQTAASGTFENQTAGRYMFTLTPLMSDAVDPVATTTLSDMADGSKFNVTLGSTVYQMYVNKTAGDSNYTEGGVYRTGNTMGYFNVTKYTTGDYAITLINQTGSTLPRIAVNSSDVGGVSMTSQFNVSTATNATSNKTIAFKTDANTASRTFVGYYWNKVVALFMPTDDTTKINGATKANIKIDK